MNTERFFEQIMPKVQECGRTALSIQKGIKQMTKGNELENQAKSALTEADLRVQEEMLKYFLDNGYNFRIFAEEETRFVDQFPKDGDVTVSLDPIDGTRAYMNNLPNFCTVIAVYQKGCLDGVLVNTPAFERAYTATRDGSKSMLWTPDGTGGFARQEFLYLPKVKDTVLTYNPKKADPDGSTAKRLDILRSLGIAVNEIDKKEMTDHSIGINSILRGEINAYFRTDVPCLDWGPISLLMEKAGGAVTDYDGNRDDIYRYWGRTDGSKESRLPSMIVSGDIELYRTVVDVLKR